MKGMFSGCSSLKNLVVSNFNTANTTNMDSMFSKCSSLKILDISNFNYNGSYVLRMYKFKRIMRF